jgi:hypothetical protein
MWLPLVMRQMSHLWSVSCHTLCSISGATSATAAVIRVWSSTTFAGNVGMNTRSLTNPIRNNPGVYDLGNEVAMLLAPLYQSTNLGNACWGTCALLESNKGVCRLARSEYILLFHLCLTGMRNCWSMSRYAIPVMVVSMKKKGPYTLSFVRAQTRSPLGCHEHVPGRRVDFCCPRSCSCGIDLTTDMKHALSAGNYGVQKSLNLNSPFSHIEPWISKVKLDVFSCIVTVRNTVHVLRINLYKLSAFPMVMWLECEKVHLLYLSAEVWKILSLPLVDFHSNLFPCELIFMAYSFENVIYLVFSMFISRSASLLASFKVSVFSL